MLWVRKGRRRYAFWFDLHVLSIRSARRLAMQTCTPQHVADIPRIFLPSCTPFWKKGKWWWGFLSLVLQSDLENTVYAGMMIKLSWHNVDCDITFVRSYRPGIVAYLHRLHLLCQNFHHIQGSMGCFLLLVSLPHKAGRSDDHKQVEQPLLGAACIWGKCDEHCPNLWKLAQVLFLKNTVHAWRIIMTLCKNYQNIYFF